MNKLVYVIGPSGGPYKIGHTSSVLRRITHMQTGSPVRLLVHFQREAPPGSPAKDIEWRAQQNLRQHHMTGEWFDCALERVLMEVEAAFLYARMLPNRPLPRVLSLEQQRLRNDRIASGMTRRQWKMRSPEEKLAGKGAIPADGAAI